MCWGNSVEVRSGSGGAGSVSVWDGDDGGVGWKRGGEHGVGVGAEVRGLGNVAVCLGRLFIEGSGGPGWRGGVEMEFLNRDSMFGFSRRVRLLGVKGLVEWIEGKGEADASSA